MKYLKIKYKTVKDKKDDAITHYIYDEVDMSDFEQSTMDGEYLYARVKDKAKEGKETVKITKKEFENKIKPKLISLE